MHGLLDLVRNDEDVFHTSKREKDIRRLTASASSETSNHVGDVSQSAFPKSFFRQFGSGKSQKIQKLIHYL